VVSLALPFEIKSKEVIKVYNEWLERKVLVPMRATSLARYEAVVDHVRSFVARAGEEDDDEPAT
jgi:hypothetical protein